MKSIVEDLPGNPSRIDVVEQIEKRGLSDAAHVFGVTPAELDRICKRNNISLKSLSTPRKKKKEISALIPVLLFGGAFLILLFNIPLGVFAFGIAGALFFLLKR